LENEKKKKLKPVTEEEARNLARKINAVKFISCSALTGSHLKDIFDEAINVVLSPKNNTLEGEDKRCSVC